MDYKFCDFSKDELDALKSIFSVSFDIKEFEKINEVYKVFKADFNASRPEMLSSKMATLDRNEMVPITNQKDFIDKYMDVNYQVGIDLPVLLKPIAATKKTIFIVAEDPLRHPKHMDENIIFSTPFGTHREDLRRKRKVYWEVATNLLRSNYNVYMTDIFKLWVKHKDQRKKEVLKGDLYQNFSKSLEQEISYFKPQLIITYGGPAYLSIKDMGVSKNKILPFLHPAGPANGKWKEIINHCTDNNKINYITNQVDKRFDELDT